MKTLLLKKRGLALFVSSSAFIALFFCASSAEALVINVNDSVTITAQVGAVIPPIMGGGPLSSGYYPPVHPEIIFECSDGIDNDNDGLTDWGRDPQCLSNLGVSEATIPFFEPYPFPYPSAPIAFPDPDPYVVPSSNDAEESFNQQSEFESGQSLSIENLETPFTSESRPFVDPLATNATILSYCFLIVLLYNFQKIHQPVPKSEWGMVVLGALGTILVLVFFPSLFTAASTLLYVGGVLLRYLTRWW